MLNIKLVLGRDEVENKKWQEENVTDVDTVLDFNEYVSRFEESSTKLSYPKAFKKFICEMVKIYKENKEEDTSIILLNVNIKKKYRVGLIRSLTKIKKHFGYDFFIEGVVIFENVTRLLKENNNKSVEENIRSSLYYFSQLDLFVLDEDVQGMSFTGEKYFNYDVSLYDSENLLTPDKIKVLYKPKYQYFYNDGVINYYRNKYPEYNNLFEKLYPNTVNKLLQTAHEAKDSLVRYRLFSTLARTMVFKEIEKEDKLKLVFPNERRLNYLLYCNMLYSISQNNSYVYTDMDYLVDMLVGKKSDKRKNLVKLYDELLNK